MHSTFQVKNDSTISLHTNGKHDIVYKRDFPSEDEELVKWASQEFGGVTSFTTIRNLKAVTSTGTKGESCFRKYVFYINRVSSIYLLVELANSEEVNYSTTSNMPKDE